MTTHHLSNDEFLTRLSTLLATTHANHHGSVFLTQKPLPISHPTTTSSSLSSPSPPSSSTTNPAEASKPHIQILIRATNGKSKAHREGPKGTGKGIEGKKEEKKKSEKEKISTIVDVAGSGTGTGMGVEEFYKRYADVCKKGMEGLRKRDRKGRKKKDKGKKGGAR